MANTRGGELALQGDTDRDYVLQVTVRSELHTFGQAEVAPLRDAIAMLQEEHRQALCTIKQQNDVLMQILERVSFPVNNAHAAYSSKAAANFSAVQVGPLSVSPQAKPSPVSKVGSSSLMETLNGDGMPTPTNESRGEPHHPDDEADIIAAILPDEREDIDRSAFRQEGRGNELDQKGMEKVGKLVEHADGAEEVVYAVENFYETKGVWQAIARSEVFGNVTLAVITANAIYLGIDAEINTSDCIWDADTFFLAAENGFCTYYLFEIIVRFLAFRKKTDCLRDGWFKFDSFLVFLMIIETWGTGLARLVSGETFHLPTAPLRLLRMLRLSRLVRLARGQTELITMVKGMRKAARAVLSTIMLLALLIYTWSIVLNALLKEEQALHANFGTIPLCMWTLFFDGTMLDSTGLVLRSVRDTGNGGSVEKQAQHVAALIFFFIFMGMSAFMMMNLLVGVLCQVVSDVSNQERDEAGVKMVKESILAELNRHDVDGNGTISEEELVSVLSNPSSRQVLKNLKVDLNYLHDFRDLLAKNYTEIPIKKVMELIVMCRGDIPANVGNMADAQRITRAFIERAMLSVEANIDRGIQRLDQSLLTVKDTMWSQVTKVSGVKYV